MSSKVGHRTIPGWSFTAILFTLALTLASSQQVWAKDITVTVDEADLIRLDRPANEIIIGNPSIADVAVQNGQLLVVTGKSFGLTNVIVLDVKGDEILNRKVRVKTDRSRLVRVHKGRERATYDCDNRCEATLTIGDAEGHFEAINKSIRNKFGVAQAALEGGDSGGQ